MRDRLISLKEMIEKEVGFSLTQKSNKRERTYARAVYCKVAREMSGESERPVSLQLVGEVINRDHTTVMHNLNVIFQFAVMERPYKRLYETMRAIFVLSEVEEYTEANKDLAERIIELKKENEELQGRLKMMELEGSRFTDLTVGLGRSDMDEVYEKLAIFVKALRSRVYA